MKRLFSNIKFLLTASALIVLSSAAASFLTNQWHWFGRSGAILTIAGVLLTFRPLVRMGLTEWLRTQSIIDYGHLIPTEEETEADRQTTLDGSASKLGITLAIIGTLVWAYGDLIGGFPS
ncbi:hypothetical protein [Pseudomonas sp. SDO55104_S430]